MSIALYRRYRPETFQEVIGQSHVTEPLMAALASGRTTHAYLFSGPRGCGKTTSARILARCLNCVEYPTDTPCGKCDSCRELARDGSGSLDVVELDAASHGGVDDARELREQAGFAPVRDRYKIFIIDEAHMVSSQGFNALLKVVEEPPEHVKFIFATTEPEKVIGTIRSRTHHYPFRLVPPTELEDYLAQVCANEGIEAPREVLSLAVRAGTGSVRDTMSVLDQLIGGSVGGRLDYERAVALLGYTSAALLDDAVAAISARDGAGLFGVVDSVVKSGHDPRRFVEDLLQRLRDLMIIALTGEAARDVFVAVPDDQYSRMVQQAMALGAGRASRSADLTNEALSQMVGATAPRLQLELLCARLIVDEGPAAPHDAGASAGASAAAGAGMGGGHGRAVPPPADLARLKKPSPQEAARAAAHPEAARGGAQGQGAPQAAGAQAAGAGQAPMVGMPQETPREGGPQAEAPQRKMSNVAPQNRAMPAMPGMSEQPAAGTQAQPQLREHTIPQPQTESKPTPVPAKGAAPASGEQGQAQAQEVPEGRQEPRQVEPQQQPGTPAGAGAPASAEQRADMPSGERPAGKPAVDPNRALAAVRGRWVDVLEAVKESSKVAGSQLVASAGPIAFENGTLVIGFEQPGLANAFGRHTGEVSDAIGRVFGKPLPVEARVGGEGAGSAGGRPQPSGPQGGGSQGERPAPGGPRPKAEAAQAAAPATETTNDHEDAQRATTAPASGAVTGSAEKEPAARKSGDNETGVAVAVGESAGQMSAVAGGAEAEHTAHELPLATSAAEHNRGNTQPGVLGEPNDGLDEPVHPEDDPVYHQDPSKEPEAQALADPAGVLAGLLDGSVQFAGEDHTRETRPMGMSGQGTPARSAQPPEPTLDVPVHADPVHEQEPVPGYEYIPPEFEPAPEEEFEPYNPAMYERGESAGRAAGAGLGAAGGSARSESPDAGAGANAAQPPAPTAGDAIGSANETPFYAQNMPAPPPLTMPGREQSAASPANQPTAENHVPMSGGVDATGAAASASPGVAEAPASSGTDDFLANAARMLGRAPEHTSSHMRGGTIDASKLAAAHQNDPAPEETDGWDEVSEDDPEVSVADNAGVNILVEQLGAQIVEEIPMEEGR